MHQNQTDESASVFYSLITVLAKKNPDLYTKIELCDSDTGETITIIRSKQKLKQDYYFYNKQSLLKSEDLFAVISSSRLKLEIIYHIDQLVGEKP